ncbi:hypothetical protein FPQ18DRAFT_68148 [Pyronema domesticum]|nr:hypothetical protein FPQ18DRAFT_68148 [Pyronema domesticum]
MRYPNDIYYDKFQLPIFLTILTVLWVVVGARLWAFRKHHPGWKSFRGISMTLTVGAAIICTLYVGLLIACYFINARILNIRDYTGQDGKERKPSTYTDEEVNTVIHSSVQLFILMFCERILLVAGLWMVKFAFVALFLETREALGKIWRRLLYFTALTILVTFVIGIWSICQDMLRQWFQPSPTQVREKELYVNGMRFTALEPSNEFVLLVSNIVTDLQLVTIGCRTVISLNRPISAASLIVIMVFITISVAISRLVLNAVNMHLAEYSSHGTIPLQLLAEMEVFVASVISCLPGLRVYFRERRLRDARSPQTVPENTVIVMEETGQWMEEGGDRWRGGHNGHNRTWRDSGNDAGVQKGPGFEEVVKYSSSGSSSSQGTPLEARHLSMV